MVLLTQVIEEMQRLHPDDSFFIVGTPSLTEAFRRAGLRIYDPESPASRPDVVILGFDTTLTYEKISLACKYLRHGAAYYGVNMDYNCPVDDKGVLTTSSTAARSRSWSSVHRPFSRFLR